MDETIISPIREWELERNINKTRDQGSWRGRREWEFKRRKKKWSKNRAVQKKNTDNDSITSDTLWRIHSTHTHSIANSTIAFQLFYGRVVSSCYSTVCIFFITLLFLYCLLQASSVEELFQRGKINGNIDERGGRKQEQNYTYLMTIALYWSFAHNKFFLFSLFSAFLHSSCVFTVLLCYILLTQSDSLTSCSGLFFCCCWINFIRCTYIAALYKLLRSYALRTIVEREKIVLHY